VPKTSAPDDVVATVSEPLAELRAHVKSVSEEAGYGGIMPAFFDIVIDREDVSRARINSLTSGDLDALYDLHVGDAVDQINVWMVEDDEGIEAAREHDEGQDEAQDEEAASPGDPQVIAHIASISADAGFDVIMPQVFGIILDREEVTAETFLALTPGDISMFYDDFVGRAVDRVTRQLSDDDANNDAVKAFLRDEFSNHVTMFSREDELPPLTWDEALDSLKQMPDHILADVTGDNDTDSTRERLQAIANFQGLSSNVDV
jgi:hypothetical protein